ncbi:hypothetical protein EZV62_015398 [Acer yangbiense]|uniref:EF-hand domain-containing protein n=1 Tax=Acer yangbiense TaxID=1000413 RepID=A0A5C7HLB7_9ROSI|nr:hypothetical protein EZV62_015398 [Acer yangbiense]
MQSDSRIAGRSPESTAKCQLKFSSNACQNGSRASILFAQDVGLLSDSNLILLSQRFVMRRTRILSSAISNLDSMRRKMMMGASPEKKWENCHFFAARKARSYPSELLQLFDHEEPSLEEVKEAFDVNKDGFIDARE